MSSIIKAIEKSLSKNKSEVPNKPAEYLEYLNNINTELMDISRDLFDQTLNLDKYRNKEASFKDML